MKTMHIIFKHNTNKAPTFTTAETEVEDSQDVFEEIKETAALFGKTERVDDGSLELHSWYWA